MNTAHVILRTLIVTWGVLLVLMATLLALYLIERWLDRSNDWVLWEDDLDEPNVIQFPSRSVIYDFEQDGHL